MRCPALILTLVLMHCAAAAAGPVRAEPVAPGVWFVRGEAALGTPANRNFISNAGYVVTRDGVVVIDGLGLPALARELRAEIRRITPLPVRHVVVPGHGPLSHEPLPDLQLTPG